MNIKDFLLVLFLFCIGIFVFMLFFIPPIEWKSIVEYFLVTSPWEWIGQILYRLHIRSPRARALPALRTANARLRVNFPRPGGYLFQR